MKGFRKGNTEPPFLISLIVAILFIVLPILTVGGCLYGISQMEPPPPPPPRPSPPPPPPPPPLPEFQASIISEENSGLVEIEIAWSWQEERTLTDEGFTAFVVLFTNTTERVVRVVWEKSSFVYDGKSFHPFIEGQKYIEAARPLSPMVIPPGASIERTMFSYGQVYYVREWRTRPISSRDVMIVLFVESGDIEDYYTIHITEKIIEKED